MKLAHVKLEASICASENFIRLERAPLTSEDKEHQRSQEKGEHNSDGKFIRVRANNESAERSLQGEQWQAVEGGRSSLILESIYPPCTLTPLGSKRGSNPGTYKSRWYFVEINWINLVRFLPG